MALSIVTLVCLSFGSMSSSQVLGSLKFGGFQVPGAKKQVPAFDGGWIGLFGCAVRRCFGGGWFGSFGFAAVSEVWFGPKTL